MRIRVLKTNISHPDRDNITLEYVAPKELVLIMTVVNAILDTVFKPMEEGGLGAPTRFVSCLSRGVCAEDKVPSGQGFYRVSVWRLTDDGEAVKHTMLYGTNDAGIRGTISMNPITLPGGYSASDFAELILQFMLMGLAGRVERVEREDGANGSFHRTVITLRS